LRPAAVYSVSQGQEGHSKIERNCRCWKLKPVVVCSVSQEPPEQTTVMRELIKVIPIKTEIEEILPGLWVYLSSLLASSAAQPSFLENDNM
jgi:hypothetical protein